MEGGGERVQGRKQGPTGKDDDDECHFEERTLQSPHQDFAVTYEFDKWFGRSNWTAKWFNW